MGNCSHVHAVFGGNSLTPEFPNWLYSYHCNINRSNDNIVKLRAPILSSICRLILLLHGVFPACSCEVGV